MELQERLRVIQEVVETGEELLTYINTPNTLTHIQLFRGSEDHLEICSQYGDRVDLIALVEPLPAQGRHAFGGPWVRPLQTHFKAALERFTLEYCVGLAEGGADFLNCCNYSLQPWFNRTKKPLQDKYAACEERKPCRLLDSGDSEPNNPAELAERINRYARRVSNFTTLEES